MITLTVEDSDLINAIKVKGHSLEAAVSYAVSQTAFAFEAQAKRNFQGSHSRRGKSWVPAGHISGSPDYPNVRTGNLRRSITTTFRQGFGSYTAVVGPTMVYARAVELGNGRGGAGYPYMGPAYRTMKPQADRIFRDALLRRMT